MKANFKNFLLLTASTLIMAVGIYFFKFANNFTFGGITGFAVLVAKFTPLSASDFSFVANILLLVVGWIIPVSYTHLSLLISFFIFLCLFSL